MLDTLFHLDQINSSPLAVLNSRLQEQYDSKNDELKTLQEELKENNKELKAKQKRITTALTMEPHKLDTKKFCLLHLVQQEEWDGMFQEDDLGLQTDLTSLFPLVILI